MRTPPAAHDTTAELAWRCIPDGLADVIWGILLNEVLGFRQQPHLAVCEVALKANTFRLSKSAVLLSPNDQGGLVLQLRQTRLYLRQVVTTVKNLMSKIQVGRRDAGVGNGPMYAASSGSVSSRFVPAGISHLTSVL